MDPERWKEIERLCQSALAMEPRKREAYLSEACQGDESLRKEVEALLANVTEARGFMKDPALDVAAKALAEEQEDALARDLIGRTVSHYRIVEKIGQGGMGEVFLADDTSLHRRVALKFLPPEMQQDAAAHKRFIREAHSAAALDHPYICGIHEVSESEGKDFIVMEYVDGQTLRARLAKGPLPLREAIRIASEVAETLVLDKEISPFNWNVTDRGIYFIDGNAKPMATICLYDFVSRGVKSLAAVHSDPGFSLDNGMSVSPDGRWLLYVGGVFVSDIMMIDNFG